MKMKKTDLVCIGLVVLAFALAAYFYPQMPERVASHWNAAGQVDGYMNKFWGLFLLPVISVFVYGLLLLIPLMDPKKENIAKFREYYDRFLVAMLSFLFYLYVLTLLWNMGARFNMTAALAPAFGVLFYYSGILLKNAKMNWFIGIRTPWTLSSERVWDKTHQRGGFLFKAAGFISLAGFFFPDYAIVFMIGPVLVFSLYLVLYSYMEYRKEKK
jgi:uncharacterized membrane protein